MPIGKPLEKDTWEQETQLCVSETVVAAAQCFQGPKSMSENPREENINSWHSLDHGVSCAISKDLQGKAALWVRDHSRVLCKRMCAVRHKEEWFSPKDIVQPTWLICSEVYQRYRVDHFCCLLSDKNNNKRPRVVLSVIFRPQKFLYEPPCDLLQVLAPLITLPLVRHCRAGKTLRII